MSGFELGDVVRHPIFGLGEVRGIDAATAKVAFGGSRLGAGEPKHLLLNTLTAVSDNEALSWRIPPAPVAVVVAVEPLPEAVTEAATRREWSEDELAVLVAAYAANEFSVGDDERDENHVLAAAFGRTRAAIDRQWRNLADIEKGGKVLHVGDNVVRALTKFRGDPRQGMRAARAIATKRGWALGGLLDREP